MTYTPDSAVYASPGAAPAPRLMDEVRRVLWLKHHSYTTEKVYLGWIRRFMLFHGKRHPCEMGGAEV